MSCIPPNPKRVGYIDPIHGPLDETLYMSSHIHQQYLACFQQWLQKRSSEKPDGFLQGRSFPICNSKD